MGSVNDEALPAPDDADDILDAELEDAEGDFEDGIEATEWAKTAEDK